MIDHFYINSFWLLYVSGADSIHFFTVIQSQNQSFQYHGKLSISFKGCPFSSRADKVFYVFFEDAYRD